MNNTMNNTMKEIEEILNLMNGAKTYEEFSEHRAKLFVLKMKSADKNEFNRIAFKVLKPMQLTDDCKAFISNWLIETPQSQSNKKLADKKGRGQ